MATVAGMKPSALIILALAFSACTAPPGWEPGNQPMHVWAATDEAWELAQVACDRWAMTGLTCVREADRDQADLAWRIGHPSCAGEGCGALTTRDQGILGGWQYHTAILEGRPLEETRQTAAHEMGHVLGIWDHLHEGGVLMNPAAESPVPTSADLDALADVWGVAPWESAAP